MTGDRATGNRTSSRERILAAVARATASRPGRNHPGHLASEPASSPVEAFCARFVNSGGEVVHMSGAEPGGWLTELLGELGLEPHGLAVGADVPDSHRPEAAAVDPREAGAGLSMAWGAAANTGSLFLHSAGGRAIQLLPPVHLVWLDPKKIFQRLEDALDAAGSSLPAAIGLHSGPSKSADIGRTLVTGVHGPGRVIALITQG